MPPDEPKRRFPPPWKAYHRADSDSFVVVDANGVPLAIVPYRDDLIGVPYAHNRLTSDEARRIAKGIARLPEFMMQRAGFHPRAGGRKWRKSHPYHVAIEDSYLRKHWFAMDAICKINSIPFNPTGEVISRGGDWRVHEFSVQLDAILFWDRFEGRWLRGEEFIFPDRPPDLPKLREPPDLNRFSRRPSGR